MRESTGETELEELSHDAGTVVIRPSVAFFAESEDEVASAVRDAAARGLAVTPRGAGTGIPSQAVGRGALLIQRRASARLEAGAVSCDPGLVKSELNRVLAATPRWMPVDPSSYESCTIGGMVANNASGARSLKYGSTVDHVVGLRVVDSAGRARVLKGLGPEEALSADPETRRATSLILENREAIARESPRVSKNSSGYRLEKVLHDGLVDLSKLFAGSEGTLGVITEATLSTSYRPAGRALYISESSLDGLERAASAFRDLAPSALELVDKSVFRKTGRWGSVARYSRTEEQYLIFSEFDGGVEELESAAERAADAVGRYDPLVITSEREIQDAWGARNETLSFAQELRRGAMVAAPGVEDLVVPRGRLGDLVRLLVTEFEGMGLEYILYGHAGDANLHARPMLDPADPLGAKSLGSLMDDCFEAVWKMGGSITGEHGDGMLRAPYVERQYPKTYWMMEELKGLYDPKGVFNPGVKIARRGLPGQGAWRPGRAPGRTPGG